MGTWVQCCWHTWLCHLRNDIGHPWDIHSHHRVTTNITSQKTLLAAFQWVDTRHWTANSTSPIPRLPGLKREGWLPPGAHHWPLPLGRLNLSKPADAPTFFTFIALPYHHTASDLLLSSGLNHTSGYLNRSLNNAHWFNLYHQVPLYRMSNTSSADAKVW